MLEKLDFSGNY